MIRQEVREAIEKQDYDLSKSTFPEEPDKSLSKKSDSHSHSLEEDSTPTKLSQDRRDSHFLETLALQNQLSVIQEAKKLSGSSLVREMLNRETLKKS